jgi:hypothetical protein
MRVLLPTERSSCTKGAPHVIADDETFGILLRTLPPDKSVATGIGDEVSFRLPVAFGDKA